MNEAVEINSRSASFRYLDFEIDVSAIYSRQQPFEIIWKENNKFLTRAQMELLIITLEEALHWRDSQAEAATEVEQDSE